MSEPMAPDHQPETAPQPVEDAASQPAPEKEPSAAKPEPRKAQFEPLGAVPASGKPALNSMEMLLDVPMGVTVELGRTTMAVQEVLDLQAGSVIELDHLAGEAVDIFVNNHLLARGEVVVVDDRFGVRITQIIAGGKGNGNGNAKGLH